jgi:hypothetical protein
MINFKKLTEYPRLKIGYDFCAESPRKWSNIGYFVTVDRNYSSPDTNEAIREIIEDTATRSNVEEHIQAIKKRIKDDLGENVVYITPVTKYEHSSVSYSMGVQRGFDYSFNGFYIVTEKTLKEFGAEEKDIEKVIKGELETYNSYANGEVYSFNLYDETGELMESCGGFYDIEDIRESLPEEFKGEDLNEYFS